jgi:hypothetical protein
MGLKDKNSNLGIPNPDSYYQNTQTNSITTRFTKTRSNLTNLKFVKYESPLTRGLGGSKIFTPSSTPAPDTSPNLGAFSSAFSDAFS